MKFKDFKKKIRNEEYDIPNILDKVRKSEYSKETKIEKENHKKSIIIRFSLAFVIVFSIVLNIIIVNNSKFASNIKYESDNYNYSVGTVDKKENLSFIFRNNNYYYGNNPNRNFFDSFSCAKKDMTSNYPENDQTTSGNNYNDMMKNEDDLVQESDIFKYDEQYIYTVYSNEFTIYRYNQDDIILSNNILLDKSSFINNTKMNLTKDYIIIYFKVNNRVKLKIYDKNGFNNVFDYETTGEIIDTKLVENKFYLVSRYIGPDKFDNPTYILNNNLYKTDYDDIIYVKNVFNQCYMYITTINLDNEITIHQSSLICSYMRNVVYISNNNLYLTCFSSDRKNGQFSTTYIYELNDNSTELKGVIQEKGVIINQYALNEYNGMIRIVYSRESSTVIQNSLHIYDLNSINKDTLLVSEIGKLDEGIGIGIQNVKSVNFDKETVYIVTYEQMDPLYKINLENPSSPIIESKVIAGGYSADLIHISSNLLVGIGYDDHLVTKISLYDIADKSEQLGLDLFLEKKYSNDIVYSVEYNFNKRSQLFVDYDNQIIGIPITYYKNGCNNAGIAIIKVNIENVERYKDFLNKHNFEVGDIYHDEINNKFYAKTEGSWEIVYNIKDHQGKIITDTYDLNSKTIECIDIISYSNYFPNMENNIEYFGISRLIEINDKYFAIYRRGIIVLNKDFTLYKDVSN